jgi:hypothetical protein
MGASLKSRLSTTVSSPNASFAIKPVIMPHCRGRALVRETTPQQAVSTARLQVMLMAHLQIKHRASVAGKSETTSGLRRAVDPGDS